MNKSSKRVYISEVYPLVDMEAKAKHGIFEYEERWICPHLEKPKTSACREPSSKAGVRNHIRAIHPEDRAEPVQAIVADPPWIKKKP